MKKVTLLVGAFLCAICSFAQSAASSMSITAVFPNGNEHVVYALDGELTASATVPEGAICNFEIVSSEDDVYVLKAGDQYLHWTSGDNTNKSADLDGLNEEFDEDINYLTIKLGDDNGLQGTTWDKEPIESLYEVIGNGTNGQPFNFTLREHDDAWIAGDSGMKFFDTNWDGNGCRTSYFRIDVTEAPAVPEYNTTTKYFTAPELRAEADATGKALIAINNVTSTGNKYITGLKEGDKVSEDGTLAGARAPYESEVLEMIPTDGGYILRQAAAEEGEGYIGLSGNNFTITVAGDATVWTVLGPDEEGYGNVSGFDDLYTDIEHSLNENMVRFIVNGNQYMNGQGYGNLGGVRGGTGAWSFNYIYNANYTEGGETPVDPEPPVVEPEELTWSPVEAGSIYAIVNLQPTGNNFYLDYLDGNLSPVDAAECNSLFEWPETAKFQAVALADGRFAFKNIGNGNYLAWKGTANRNNTTGVNDNEGWTADINEHSSWSLNESTRYEGAYWFRAEQRNDIADDGQNITGTFIIGNDGAWNAWTTGEYLPANGTAFSNSFAFYLIEKGEAPVDPVEPSFDYAAAVAPVVAEANAALEGHDNVWVTTFGDNLITRNDQFSSPYTETREGSINNLIDGNQNSYWHSSWAASVPNHTHYIQVELDEAISGDVLATMSRRVNVANDHCVLMGVEASLDGVNYVSVGQMEFPYTGTPATQQATFNLAEEAKYLRFYNDESNGSYQRGYWHMSEFQLNSFSTELNPDAADYAYPTAVAELQEALAAALAVQNGTQADVDALAAAVEAYKAALAAYPEFTEWDGTLALETVGEVKTIDDLLKVDFVFNRALTVEDSGFGALAGIFDETGDCYALVFDPICGSAEFEAVKDDAKVAQVAHLEFQKISDLTEGFQASAKAAAAKIGGFQPVQGTATILVASKSFRVDGEKYNEFKKATYEFATGAITSIETIVVPATVDLFDLQGRRVNAAQNGLFIQNGKKVLR